MNRVLSSLAATLVMVANLTAAPVPDHQKDQQAPKTLPKSASKSTQAKNAVVRKKTQPKPYQVGVASWYGKQFHGKATASGEDFNMFELTAAYRQLPLGTY